MTRFFKKIKKLIYPLFGRDVNMWRFLPTLAPHWFFIIAFGIGLSISAIVLVIIAPNRASVQVIDEQELIQRTSVLNKKLLNNVLKTYRIKKEKTEELKRVR